MVDSTSCSRTTYSAVSKWGRKATLTFRKRVRGILLAKNPLGHVILRSKFILGNNGVLALLGISARQAYLTLCEDCLDLRIVLGNKVIFGSVNSNRSHFEIGVDDMLGIEREWPRF